MPALFFLGGVLLLNLWMTRHIVRAGERFDHKKLHTAMVWLVPVIGAAAAREHLGVDLGVFACALLEREPALAWAPQPDEALPQAPTAASAAHR